MARRTFIDYQAAITHALGDSPSTGETAAELVNNALMHLGSLHEWRWRRGGPTSLSLTADQSYVLLPADFGTDEYVTYPGSVSRRMIRVTMMEIQEFRSFTTTPPGFTFYYAINTGQSTTAASGLDSQQRLEIYPTPADTVADALTVIYRRNLARMTANGDVPQIPDWLDYPLDLLCRSFAMTLEDDNPNNAAQIMFDKLLPDLKARDSMTQRRLGVMRGGLMPRTIPIDPMYPTSIGDPQPAS